MPKTKFILIITIAFILATLSCTVAFANNPDTVEESFTVEIWHTEKLKTIDIHKVAEYNSDDTFTLLPEYSDLDIDVNNLKYSKDKIEATAKLKDVAISFAPDYSKTLNTNSEIFKDLGKGMYLVLVTDINDSQASCLIGLPSKDQLPPYSNGLVIVPKVEEPEYTLPDVESDEVTNPQTGDIETNTALYLHVLFFSLVLMAAALVAFKKIKA